MRFLDNTKMGPKLIGAFVLVAFMLVGMGFMAVSKIQTIEDADTMLYEKMTVPLGELGDIMQLFQRQRVNTRDAILTGDAEKFGARIHEIEASMNKVEESFQKTIILEANKAVFKRYTDATAEYNRYSEKILDLVKAGKPKEAEALLRGDGFKANQAVQDVLEELQTAKLKVAKATSEGNTVIANGATRFMYIMMGIVTFFAIGLGLILTRSITIPLSQGVDMMKEMSKGHLSTRLKMDRTDEIGDLARAMDGFTDNLQGIVVGLTQVSKGDLSKEWVAADAQDEIAPALKQVRASLIALVEETGALIDAAKAGTLGTRAKAERVEGVYAKLLKGNNEILDAVVAPINEVKRVMGAMEQGDLTARITAEYQGDLQLLRNAVNNTAVKLGQTLMEISAASNTLASSSDELSTSSTTMAGSAEQMTQQANTAAAGTEQASANVKNMAAGIEQISANSNTVASASEEVSANLRTVGAAVEQMSSNMKTISSTTEQVTNSVNTVATAIEEMSVSLNEVSKNSGQAAAVANRAAKNAQSTAETVDKLGKSAQEIGKVVDMIKGIAAQTNLLALNATIEAASAGDAGKGFAVVANEVKELAKQTAGATEEIRSQVEGMQANTQQAVKAIDEIVQVINEINNISGSIAASVEEQTATTNEIAKNVGFAARGANEVSKNVQQATAGANEVSRNVQEAVKGATDISRNINQLAAGSADAARNAGEAAKGMNDVAQNVAKVSSAARDTTRGAADTNTAARDLARLAEKLQSAVSRFKL